jgi:Fe-S-cluster containining protein
MDFATDRPLIVDQQAFDRLECNRCGECCQRIGLRSKDSSWKSPLEVVDYFDEPEEDHMEFSVWVGNLLPYKNKDDDWRYRCSFLGWDNAKAVCTVQDSKPRICAEFPYGRPNHNYERCVWNVVVVDFDVVMKGSNA